MSLNTPVCHRHKSCRDWLAKVFILPASQRFIGYSVGQVKFTVGGVRHGSRRCQPLVLYADNGAAMKSQPLQMKLHELNITPSHSRPRVSNDNAYAESLFRTLKYVPQWPSSEFKTLDDARNWVDKFTHMTLTFRQLWSQESPMPLWSRLSNAKSSTGCNLSRCLS